MPRTVTGVAVRGSGTASDRWTDPVKDKDLTAPPGSPSLGDRYIVASVAAGFWAGHENDITEWAGSVWQFFTPTLGLTAYVEDEMEYYSWNGTAWAQESAGPHAVTHQDGGTDEVATLTPAAGAIPKADGAGKIPVGFIPAAAPAGHKTTHENGGTDEVDVGGLSGELADPQPPKAHEASHNEGGSDQLDVEDLATDSVTPSDVVGGDTTFGQLSIGQPKGWKASVISTLNAPPGASVGDRYRIGSSPTGIWTGHAHELVEKNTMGSWTILSNTVGDVHYHVADGLHYGWSGSAWLVMPYDHATSHKHGGGDEVATSTAGANLIPKADASGKLNVAWMPAALIGALNFQGFWNASTNTPTLADGTGTKGHFYVATVAGSQDLGSGSKSYNIGDWVLHDGSIWEKIDHTDAVASVFGRIGAVVAVSGDYTHAETSGQTADDHHAQLHAASHKGGGADEIDAATSLLAGLMDATDKINLEREISTGIITGGVLSINADPTKFDLTAGTGIIVDNWTDPNSVAVTPVSWSAKTAEAPLNIATETITRVAIDSTGNIVKQNGEFTQNQVRDLVIIGAVVHPLHVNVTSVYQRGNTVYGGEPNVVDFVRMVGNVTDGNVFSPNGANLKIDKSAGQTYRIGVNYATSRKRPNVSDDSSGAAISLAYTYRDGSGGFSYVSPSTDVDPDYWDDDSGTLQLVPPNKFTVQRIFHAAVPGALGTIAIHYGQKLYGTIDEAVTGIDQDRDSLVTDPLLENASFRTWLIVRRGTTSLQAVADAHIISAGKFGDVVSGGGGTTASLTSEAVVWVARKSTAGTIAKGSAVRIVGYDAANFRVLVETAKADAGATMPAIGIAFSAITDTADGYAINVGSLSGIDTSSWAVGTELYVSATVAGALTSTRPTGTALVQKVAQVARQDASSGTISVFGAGRSNDVPNIPEGMIWQGNASGVAATIPHDPVKWYDAASLDSPDGTADVPGSMDAAPTGSDSVASNIPVRVFPDDVEKGVLLQSTVRVPVGAADLRVHVQCHAKIAPGSTVGPILMLYRRKHNYGVARGSWNAGVLFGPAIPTNTHDVLYTAALPVASWGLSAGDDFQLLLSRDPLHASDTLVDDFEVRRIGLEFY